MENLQGLIKRMITFIMLFVTVLCGSVWGQAVNGKITLKIESKPMTPADAQRAITQKTPIYLTVSMIMEGEWVTYLDNAANSKGVKLGSCQFAYAIAQTSGSTRAEAPFDKNPAAYVISGNVSCPNNNDDLAFPQYYTNQNWNQTGCPTYGYGLEFSNTLYSMQNSIYASNRRKVTEGGRTYYEVDLFPIAFYLKSLSTIYVRGVDVDGSKITDPDDNDTRDNGANVGVTQINIYNNSNVAFTKSDGTGGDWTFGTDACWGGIIPGGIFIEQAPEVGQFEPLFDGKVEANNTAFCPGDKVQLVAQVKYPSGKQPSGYNVQLWANEEWDDATNKPIGANQPKIALNAGDGTSNTKGGYTITQSATANASGAYVYTITMTKAEFNNLSSATPNTTLKKFLRLVVQEADADTKPGTAVTSAQYADLPKLYVNVGPVGLGALGEPRTAATPFDKVEGLLAGVATYLRNDCEKHMTASAADNSCYSKDNAGLANKDIYATGTDAYASTTTGGLSGYASVATGGAATRVQVTLGSDPTYYYNRVTWSNGCKTPTDTVLIVPKKELTAPELEIFSDCSHLKDAMSPFSMQATGPDGVTITKWQWVIRAESNGQPTKDGNYTHPQQGAPCRGIGVYSDKTDADAPLKPSSCFSGENNFGGGFVFEFGPEGYSEYIQNGYDSYVIDFDIAFSGGATSTFTVTSRDIDGSPWSVPTILGQWLPFDPDPRLPVGSSKNSLYDGEALWTAGESKWVYVRYQVNGEWSPWAFKATGSQEACGPVEKKNYFGITVQNAQRPCAGNQMSKAVECETCTADTNVQKNEPLQFFLTTFTVNPDDYDCTVELKENETIQFYATDKDGNIEIFSTIKGPQTWSWATYHNSAYGCDHIDTYGAQVGALMIPAPDLYTATKSVKVRARRMVTNSSTGMTITERSSGWPVLTEPEQSTPNGLLVNDCAGIVKFDLENNAAAMGDEYVDVIVGPKPVKLEAKRDGTVIDNNDAMCVGETLELTLKDVDMDATLEWFTSTNGTTWTSTGNVNDFYTYVPTKNDITASAPGTATTRYFRCKVTVDGESQDVDFAVKLFWAEKLIIGSTGVTPATALTTGVCDDVNVTLTGTPQDNKAFYTDVDGEFFDDGWTPDPDLKPSKLSDGKRYAATFKAYKQYWDNIPLRFKSKTATGIKDYTCYAYSDTVTLKVNKVDQGSIEGKFGNELCSGQGNELTYTGDGDVYEWFWPGNVSPTPDATGATVTYTPTATSGSVEIWVTASLSSDPTCYAETPGTFTIKKCNITLSPDDPSFCQGEYATDGLTLTLQSPYPVTDLWVSSDGGTTWPDDPMPSANYDVSTAATDGKIKLKGSYVSTLAPGNYAFSADVTTDQGSKATDNAVVRVDPLPTFTGTPTNTTNGPVCEGTNLTFTAAASSSGASLSYQWYYAATQAAADAHTGTADGTGAVRTITTSGANRATYNGRWYYAKITATNSATGCTAEAYTPSVQAVINPLPDMTGVITGTKIGGVSGTSLNTCAGTAVEMEVTTDATKGYTYTYTWKKNTSSLPAGVTASDLTPANTGSKLSFTASAAATGNNATYNLTVEASALGCKASTSQGLTINFVNCTGDKLSDAGGSATYGKSKAYTVCANDNESSWPYVRVVPGFETAAISGVTLYHSTTKNGTYTQVSPAVAGPNYSFNVKAAGTTYNAPGSHYYYAKLDRTGYASTFTDTAEYVVGAMPDYSLTGLAAGKAMAKSKTSLGLDVDGPVADLTLCNNLTIDLSLQDMPTPGSDATAAAGIPADDYYYWYKGTTAAVPDRSDVTGYIARGDNYTMTPTNSNRPTANGTAAYYYVYRNYKRQTPINSISGTFQTCTSIFKVGNPVKVTVNPMPTMPSGITPKTEDLCAGETFTLTTTTNTSAPTGTTWTYRWFVNRASAGDAVYTPAYGQAALTTPTVATPVPAVNTGTSTVQDKYKLKVYATVTATGCTDSTALLGDITVNITPRPTLTAPALTKTTESICVGESKTLTATGAAVNPAAGNTIRYQWYKMKAGASAPDTNQDTKVGTASTANTLSLNGSAALSESGTYYVRIFAGSNCPASALSTNQCVVTVYPLPDLSDAFTVTTCNKAGNAASVCMNEDNAELVVTPKDEAPYNTYTYTYAWNGGAATASGTWKIPTTAAGTGSDGTKTYTVKVTATSPANQGGCSQETTLSFTVKVSNCAEDQILDGNDQKKDATTPFTVCAGEAAWPTIKVQANDNAGNKILKIELLHAFNSRASGDFKVAKTWTPNEAEKTVSFNPLTETAESGDDLKQTGSHYYKANVTREGNNSNKVTVTVEYVVGAMPEPTVVNGGVILVSTETTLAAAKTAGATGSLTLCAGPAVKLYADGGNLGTATRTSPEYAWYSSASNITPVPAKPSAAMTQVTGSTAELSTTTSGVTTATTTYYYSYQKFRQSTAVKTTTPASTKLCDTVYPLSVSGERIVNPMPNKPTVSTVPSFTRCPGETFDLTPTITGTANTSTTWSYRWYKKRDSEAEVPANPASASDPDLITAAWTNITATVPAGTTAQVKDVYRLRVNATTTAGCKDSVDASGTVTINAAPYLKRPTVTVPNNGKVCAGETITLTATIDETGKVGAPGTKQWYKLKAGETTPDISRDQAVSGANYGGATSETLTVTANSDDVNGSYYMVVNLTNVTCTGVAYSEVKQIQRLSRPVVRVADTSLMSYTLCTNAGSTDQTTLRVTLDDATMEGVGSTATLSYEWHKVSHTGALVTSGNTTTAENTLVVKASDLDNKTNANYYYFKITKTVTDDGCPTTVWIDDARPASGNAGMNKRFTVTGVSCGKDVIVNKDAPTVALTSAAATAICSSDADGKSFLVRADARGPISKATWYYAPVTAISGNTVTIGTPVKAKECTTAIAANTTGCEFNTKTDGAMTAAGEWRIWVEVERTGSNNTYTDSIHFVVRPNPSSLSNESSLALKLRKQTGNTEVTDFLVCNPTPVKLQLEPAATLTALGAGNKLSGEADPTDVTKYAWYRMWASGTAAATTETYTFTAAENTTQAVTTAGAPAGADIENKYELRETYERTFKRSTGPATYNITCPAISSGTTPLQKTFPVSVYVSRPATGTLKDADNKTEMSVCSDARTGKSVTLVMTPGANTPAAAAIVWEYQKDGGTWQTWSTVADGTAQTAANTLTVSLTDPKITPPDPDKSTTYTFRVKIKNGAACDEVTVAKYDLKIYGALTAGTLGDIDAVCATASNFTVTAAASGFSPADANVTFRIYDTDPSTGSPTPLKSETKAGSGGSATQTLTVSPAPTAEKTYYVRYEIAPASGSPCGTVYSDVKTVKVYPSPTIKYSGTVAEQCFTDNTTVNFTPIAQTNTTGFDVYAFSTAQTEANLKAAIIAGTATPVTTAAANATGVSVTYTASGTPQAMFSGTTYYYFVAKSGIYATDKSAACAMAIDNTTVTSKNPIEKPVITWKAPATPSTTELTIDRGQSHDIDMTGGNRTGATAKEPTTLYYAVPLSSDPTKPDESKRVTVGTFTGGSYTFPANMTAPATYYYWVETTGTPCGNVKSDPIKANVFKSDKLSLTGDENVCSTGDIEMEVYIDGDNADGISDIEYYVATSATGPWTQKLDPANPPAGSTVTIGADKPFKLTWSNHGLGTSAAAPRWFMMKYTSSGGTPNQETTVFPLTVRPQPTLSTPDVFNDMPKAICEGTEFTVAVKDGVVSPAKGTAGITWEIKFTNADTTAATFDTWAAKGSDSYKASRTQDSGWYRLRVKGHDVCQPVLSNSALLIVNHKPTPGQLAVAPVTVCFGAEATVTLSGYTDSIVDYEYNVSHTAGASTATGWKPVSPDLDADVTGLTKTGNNYPATWKVKAAKYGYALRAVVKNGVCPAEYAYTAVNIYDTVAVKTQPKDQPATVDETTKLPTATVKFSTDNQWAGTKYKDNTNTMVAPTAQPTFQWEVSTDGSTWANAGGTGVSGATAKELQIAETYWTGKTETDVANTKFRAKITDACGHYVYTKEVGVVSQVSLRAGDIESLVVTNQNGCFYYGDTVILYHDDAKGEGHVSHHWRVGSGTTPSSATVKTLDEAGLAYRFGYDEEEGKLDSTVIYLAPKTPQSDLAAFWNTCKDIFVFVTDSLNKYETLFETNGHLKANQPDEDHADHYAHKALCFSEKPNWEMPNDTICANSTTAEFQLDAANVSVNASGAPNITGLKFAFKATAATDFEEVLDFVGGSTSGTYTVTVDGTPVSFTATMEQSDGKPSGKLTLSASPINEAFDSLLIRTVVRTDYSQKDDATLYTVLRIDRGIKPLEEKDVDERVCEGESIEFSQTLERYNPSIESELTWEWEWRYYIDDGNYTTTPTNGTPLTGSTTAGNPAPVKLTINDVKPEDSGFWVLKVTTACGVVEEQEFTLKVDVKPTWAQNPTATDADFCAGDENRHLDLSAVLNVNWEPDMKWQRANTAAGPYSDVTVDGTRVVATATATPGQINCGLTANPTYVSDSGYYRIALTAPAGSACAGKDLGTSGYVYIHLDTTPQLKLSNTTLGVKIDGSDDLILTVLNPVSPDCTPSTTWMVIGGEDEEAVTLSAFQTGAGNAFASNLDAEGNTLHVKDAPSAMNGLKVFATVTNCCGTTNSDTVPITVSGELKIEEVEGDAVCEGQEATLTVKANQTVKEAVNRKWKYATPDAPANWIDVPAAWGATEDMVSGVATLTIPNAPYALDGYRFVLDLTDGGETYRSGEMTLMVRPVNELHVYVDIAPNPAHGEAAEPGEDARNRTEITATVYVGDDVTEADAVDWSKVRVLSPEELSRYGYTTFDWYQLPAGDATGTPVEPSTDEGHSFRVEGDMHGQVIEIVDLNYEVHNLSRYYAVLKACEDKPSNVDTLLIYTDLLVEWAADDMYTTDTMPYGTTVDDLYTKMLPPDYVIGVHLENPDPDAKHQISSAYYLKCDDGGDAYLNTELRKGVQSDESDEVIIATRKWFYREGPGDEWHGLVTDDIFGSDPVLGDRYDVHEGRRTLELRSVAYDMNGYQFMMVVLADSIGLLPDGGIKYQYQDTTPILTLVVSEPLPEDLAFKPFEDEGSCSDYGYVFELDPTHESYHYTWEIKRPGETDYQPVEALKDSSAFHYVFHYGPATEADNGTMIRATVSNFCGDVSTEAELRVMTVDIEAETAELCADGTLDLTATVNNGGSNPAYAWYVNGTPVPDATEATFTFNPATLTPAENGLYDVQVRVTASSELQFVNPMACADTTVTVHPLPAGVKATVDPASVTVVDSATLSVSGAEGCTVVWTPDEWLHDASAAETSTRPIPTGGSYWFYVTVTSEHGCSVTDSVELVVASSFTYDSTEAVVIIPPFPFEEDGDGLLPAPDTALQVTQAGDTLRITACKNSIALLMLCTSGGDAPLVYAWEGIEPLTEAELEEAGLSALPDSVFAFYFDGSIAEFGCTVTERNGEGLSVHLQAYVSYHQTQHVVLEAMPTMRQNRYYDGQAVFFTPHPTRFPWYNYYSYTVTDDLSIDRLIDRRQTENYLYKTDFKYEDGDARRVYVSVADQNGCRSYDSVDLNVLQLPNAMICNDPNYPDACILFPEFPVEIHDSWGRLVKSMDDGLGWDARRSGKLVEGGTYYYRVMVPTQDGYTEIKGAVTVFTKKK